MYYSVQYGANKSALSKMAKFDLVIINDNHPVSLHDYWSNVLCNDVVVMIFPTITLHPFSQRPFFSHFEPLPLKMSVCCNVEGEHDADNRIHKYRESDNSF